MLVILELPLFFFSSRSLHTRYASDWSSDVCSSDLRAAKSVPELAQPARPWPTDPEQRLPEAGEARKTEDIFRPTNIWLAHLNFSAEQWRLLEPRRIDPVPKLFQPGGEVILRNPKAQRSGLA